MRDLIPLLIAHGALIVFVITLAARIGAPVLPNEGEWIIKRLAELLEWDRPRWKDGA